AKINHMFYSRMCKSDIERAAVFNNGIHLIVCDIVFSYQDKKSNCQFAENKYLYAKKSVSGRNLDSKSVSRTRRQYQSIHLSTAAKPGISNNY
ncbi:MAG: hypothetical protein EBU90_31185, partial [Proteobacteria bacterium]|nr:hypothetical protein [Pseudomonadota bacterium]